MHTLNLPDYKQQVLEENGKKSIMDQVRKKYVALTPEEWVRQNFISYLVNEKNYPLSLMSVEKGLRYNRLSKRSDIQVFSKEGKLWMLIECKAPTVKLSNEVFRQVAIYNSGLNQQAKYLAITNGLQHYCCEINFEAKDAEPTPKLAFLKEFPMFAATSVK